MNALLTLIVMPIAAGAAILLFPAKGRSKDAFAVAAAAANLVLAAALYGKESVFSVPWASFEFSLRLYYFSAFSVAACAFFAFLILLYSTSSLAGRDYAKRFYSLMLLSVGFANGALLADNLVAMLFFWEGLLIALFGMIAIGNKNAFKTAIKMFVILGACDLAMMVGVALAGNLAGTMTMSKMKIATGGLGGLAFMLLMVGAISKAGSMPFHTWIPDAAIDAPLPFMAAFPGALEKLIGIYFLTRISLDMFALDAHSWISAVLMTIGALTIIFAVMMALVQKDYKRLLSYHAISQVGYMVLGIGTMIPVGIIGGLFHMINNALYKCCLFLTGGAVEKQCGTTDLEKLGGLAGRMPVTFACFAVTALSISGVPPFNGFFSKELVYDGALERGMIFYVAAVAGSFFTAASFLKLGHAAFLGQAKKGAAAVKEAPVAMLVPMVIIAAICVLFGLWNSLPINSIIQPILGPAASEGHGFSGFPKNMTLVAITVAVLLGALANHIYGAKKTGKGIGAVDHIYHAPALYPIYGMAQKGYFDLYVLGTYVFESFSYMMSLIDKSIDYIYNVAAVKAAGGVSYAIRKAHDGSYKTYLAWSFLAGALVFLFLVKVR